MLSKRIWIAGVLVVALLAVMPVAAQEQPSRDCIRGTFPNAHSEPPVGWDGPVFELSQDYPETLADPEAYPWLDIEVVDGRPTDPYAYSMAVKDYVLEGNVETDFVVQENPVRPWYHLPWMHYSKDGREFIRGLTHELDSSPQQLDPRQTDYTQTWAVSVMNDRGAWAIGNIWCDPDNPQPGQLNPVAGEPNAFPDGTAQVKLLFTTATPDDSDSPYYVPYLEGTLEWVANIYANPDHNRQPVDPDDPNSSPEREPQIVRLIQMDIAVRDDRIRETGWVFGTFLYDANLGVGETPFDRMVPVGLMWGNDPGITPQMAANGVPLQESWVNIALTTNGGDHLGWGGRVNGPMDNPVSSCMSCHMPAGYPEGPILPEMIFGFGDPIPPATRLTWMDNIPAGVPFSQDQCYSVDYSLQTQIGLDRWETANQERINVSWNCPPVTDDDKNLATDRDTNELDN